MVSPGRTKPPGAGWLSDIEQLERETRLAQQTVKETTGVAEAAGGLVQATVTGHGRLVELDLDPRVYRDLAPEVLAVEIIAAVNEAQTKAQENALEVFAGEVAAGPAEDDPAFGPLLAELARMRLARDGSGVPR
jgi:DNA-binding protein YbaB